MSFEVITAERRWLTSGNPLYKFMFDDFHPDIEIFSSVNGMWSHPRRPRGRLSEKVSIFDELGIPLI